MARKTKPVFEEAIGVMIGDTMRFSALQKATLKKHLMPSAIDAMELCLDGWASVHQCLVDQPKIGEVKAALDNIQNLAAELAHALGNADTFTGAFLLKIAHLDLHNVGAVERMQKQLQVLADRIELTKSQLPKQGFKSTPVFSVTQIANFLGEYASSITPAKSDCSPFREIVETCFEAMGVESNAEHAIKKFIETTKENSHP